MRAARVIDLRHERNLLEDFAAQLVGPIVPQKQSEKKDWPEEGEAKALLWTLVRMLASPRSEDRYRAAHVVSLRGQSKAYWREIKRLPGPTQADASDVPATGYETEDRYGRDDGWMRRLLGEGRRYKLAKRLSEKWGTEPSNVTSIHSASEKAPKSNNVSKPDGEELTRLVFGTYVGLLRDTSSTNQDSKEGHRVRRDALTQIRALLESGHIDLEAALAVYRRAIHDPSHIVRKVAMDALLSAYSDSNSLEPYRLGLQGPANVARYSLDELVTMATAGEVSSDIAEAASKLALDALNVSLSDVRMYALTQALPKLYSGAQTSELSILALESLYPDIRFAVLDQLRDSTESRVQDALAKALESDHEALRLKAAHILASRGDTRTADVLVGLFQSDDHNIISQAEEAVMALGCPTRPDQLSSETLDMRAQAAAGILLARAELEESVDRKRLLGLLGRVGHRSADPFILEELKREDENAFRKAAFEALLNMALIPQVPKKGTKAAKRRRYHEEQLLDYIKASAISFDADIRKACAEVLADIDDQRAEALLLSLVADRDESVRVTACRSLVIRVEHVEQASLEPLLQLSRQGKRELVLPVAEGLAFRQSKESFIPLMLLLKAGLPEEKERALKSLGVLGDVRAVPDLVQMLEPETIELFEDLVPTILEALVRLLVVVDVEQRADLEQLINHHLHNGTLDSRKGILLGLRHAADTWSRVRLQSVAVDVNADEQLVLYAIELLRELKSTESADVLTTILKSERRRRRKAAQKALVEIFEDNLSLAYMPSLDVSHSDIRLPAIQYLARHGDPEILLKRFEQIHNENIRTQLRRGLARRELDTASCLPIMLSMLTSDSTYARIEAAWLLCCLESAMGAQLVEALLDAAIKAKQNVESKSNEHELEFEALRASLWALGQLSITDDIEFDGAKLDVVYSSSCSFLDSPDTPAELKVQILEFISLGWVRTRASSSAQLAETSMLSRLSDVQRSTRVATMFAYSRLQANKLTQALAQKTIMPDLAIASVDTAMSSEVETMLKTPKTQAATLTHLLKQQSNELLEVQLGKDQPFETRRTAILLLGRKGGEQAESLLTAILEDSSESVELKKLAYAALKRAKRRQNKSAQELV